MVTGDGAVGEGFAGVEALIVEALTGVEALGNNVEALEKFAGVEALIVDVLTGVEALGKGGARGSMFPRKIFMPSRNPHSERLCADSSSARATAPSAGSPRQPRLCLAAAA